MKHQTLLKRCFLTVVLCLGALSATATAEEPVGRASLWVDLYHGEPLLYEHVLEDLAEVRVIYLGERHRLVRHHEIQARIVTDLAKKKVPLVLGLEQLESFQQPALDKYNRGEIDFDELAKETDWANRWRSFGQYRPVLEAAHKAGAEILALNARAETIRQVARGGGVDKLKPELRRQLPADVQLKDPPYETLLNLYMNVHMAATPERLRPMIEAQMARDEQMAFVLSSYLKSKAGKGKTAIVLCGSGHVAYGLGTASRVRRRMPQVKDRIVLMSESGDVELTEHEKAVSRPIRITHDDLKKIGRPIADYLHVTSLKPPQEKLDEKK